MILKLKRKITDNFPYTEIEEKQMLDVKIQSARYMLQRHRPNNIYQERLDKAFPDNEVVIALWLAGLSDVELVENTGYSVKDIHSIISLYKQSNGH